MKWSTLNSLINTLGAFRFKKAKSASRGFLQNENQIAFGLESVRKNGVRLLGEVCFLENLQ